MGAIPLADERAANAIDKKLGERLRAYRLDIGMSQEQLAEILGITFQQVQKYEKGMNRIAASRLFDISAALGIPIQDFFAGLKGAGKTGPRRSLGSDALAIPGADELLRSYANLRTPKLRRHVLALVRVVEEGDR